MDPGLCQRLIDPGLIRPQGASALQNQGNAFERKTPLDPRNVQLDLHIHDMRSMHPLQ